MVLIHTVVDGCGVNDGLTSADGWGVNGGLTSAAGSSK